MFSVEYKPGVSQGGSVICPIASLFCYDLSASTSSSSAKGEASFASPCSRSRWRAENNPPRAGCNDAKCIMPVGIAILS